MALLSHSNYTSLVSYGMAIHSANMNSLPGRSQCGVNFTYFPCFNGTSTRCAPRSCCPEAKLGVGQPGFKYRFTTAFPLTRLYHHTEYFHFPFSLVDL